MDRLLPCPFCGDHVIPDATERGHVEHPSHEWCPLGDSLTLLPAWNRRAPSAHSVTGRGEGWRGAVLDGINEAMAIVTKETLPEGYGHPEFRQGFNHAKQKIVGKLFTRLQAQFSAAPMTAASVTDERK